MLYLHDVLFVRMLLAKMTVAEQHGVTPDITADSSPFQFTSLASSMYA